jgi:hypothetical protein
MAIIDRYIWVVFIVMTAAVIVHVRRRLSLHDPRGAAIAFVVGNLPWIVQGCSSLKNPDMTVHDIIGFHAGWIGFAMIGSVVVVWAALFHWLFIQRGAEQLEANPIGVLNLPRTATGIRLFFLAAFCGGVVGLIAMIAANK